MLKLKVFITLLFLFANTSAKCQKKAKWYYPNGNEMIFKTTNLRVGNVIDSALYRWDLGAIKKIYSDSFSVLNGNSSIYTTYSPTKKSTDVEVYFLALTNKPFLIYSNNTLSIKQAIASYNYSEYLNSYSYYWQLNNMISHGLLNKRYLTMAFQKPDTIYWLEDSISAMIYRKYNAEVFVRADTPYFANVSNYRERKKYGITYDSYEIIGDENTTGFSANFNNYSDKIIKYIYITVTAENAVEDVIGTKTVRGIGPIKPNSFANYSFDNIFYSSVVEYLSIISLKIIYMDGTTKIISKDDVRKIENHDWIKEGKRISG